MHVEEYFWDFIVFCSIILVRHILISHYSCIQ